MQILAACPAKLIASLVKHDDLQQQSGKLLSSRDGYRSLQLAAVYGEWWNSEEKWKIIKISQLSSDARLSCGQNLTHTNKSDGGLRELSPTISHLLIQSQRCVAKADGRCDFWLRMNEQQQKCSEVAAAA